MDLGQLKKEAEDSISLIKNTSDLEQWRIKYLGRKSALSLFFNSLAGLSLEEKKKQGQMANEISQLFSSLYERVKKSMENNLSSFSNFIDITQPGNKLYHGHIHPLTSTLHDIINSFQKIGFSIIEGPEIETEYYNFDALNIPAGHPAREMWDTLWIKSGIKNQKSKVLLRTHTSPMQVRYMEMNQPPFRIIVPGKCFRYEAVDTSHEIQFHQIEGLMVGENINLTNFKAIIEEVVEDIFKQKVLIRFRPSYFPFVSPGVEVDIKIKLKDKNQKSKIKNEWLEIMGAGMVHPDLFKRVGYEINRWQGFAFGLGVERIAMIKYHIDDIRLFFSPDIRFLEQF
jgi:phenylalanyl-tRNA synthetase alpha chain